MLQLRIVILVVACLSTLFRPADAWADKTVHYRCEDEKASGELKLVSVRGSRLGPGRLLSLPGVANEGSWQFDGRTAIAYSLPSNTVGFDADFTWEGFFLSPKSNALRRETGIADRLVTQFAFDKGNWTRLAIGLAGDNSGAARLCVSLEGFEGRTFGWGKTVVAPDQWHHFALVHEGTAAAARIRWFLDYKLCGELFLGGQANQNTLRPPGSSPITIGARLLANGTVNRGFSGWMDEIRLSPRPLDVGQFLRTKELVERQPSRLPTNVDDRLWQRRHAWARQKASGWMKAADGPKSIDAFFDAKNRSSRIDGEAFLRRLSLVVQGRIPTLQELQQFQDDRRPDKRMRAIDRMLASPDWGHAWVGYWQDVLAENPSVVFPTLNNSGPFRQWIYESFRDNRSFDRFVTELTLMERLAAATGASPEGFALATGNDAPMAMRTHVLMKAFAAVDLKCARCHDSPIESHQQSELFQLAALLNDGPLEVPATSVAAVAKAENGTITTSLRPGQRVEPRASERWFTEPNNVDQLWPVQPGRHRAMLAALITSPLDSRFTDVIVNRIWKRLFGWGLVEPVNRWDRKSNPQHARLLLFLSSYLVQNDYDLKSLVRLIVKSEVWQSAAAGARNMSAEQLVDSLFVAVRKDFEAETLGVHATDPGAAQLPKPRRAWQFSALPNERDRPALVMPVNQTIVDVMTTFGWNGNRQQPRTERDAAPTALQPLILFNGLLSQRIVRLSERSAVTELCLQEIPLPTLVERLFLMFLSRRPDADERSRFVHYLASTYAERRTGREPRPWRPLSTFQPDWRKHLEAGQTRLLLEAQKSVAKGEPPTRRLTDAFRKRAEDVVWALINSPEFVVIP